MKSKAVFQMSDLGKKQTGVKSRRVARIPKKKRRSTKARGASVKGEKKSARLHRAYHLNFPLNGTAQRLTPFLATRNQGTSMGRVMGHWR